MTTDREALLSIAAVLKSLAEPLVPQDTAATSNSADGTDNGITSASVLGIDMTQVSAMPNDSSQLAIAWGATVEPEFVNGVLWIRDQIGLDPSALMACMKFESNLNPKAKNPKSSATGLIQFMEATAKRLGTTTAKLATMSRITQLSYVYRYFEDFHKRGFKLDEWSVDDTYMAILWPAGIGKPDGYAVFNKALASAAYAANSGLDSNHDGIVTKSEACQRVRDLLAFGLMPGNVMVLDA